MDSIKRQRSVVTKQLAATEQSGRDESSSILANLILTVNCNHSPLKTFSIVNCSLTGAATAVQCNAIKHVAPREHIALNHFECRNATCLQSQRLDFRSKSLKYHMAMFFLVAIIVIQILNKHSSIAVVEAQSSKTEFGALLSDLFDATTSFDSIVRARLKDRSLKAVRHDFGRDFRASRDNIDATLAEAASAARRLRDGMLSATAENNNNKTPEGCSEQHQQNVDQLATSGQCARPDFVNAKRVDETTRPWSLLPPDASYNYLHVDFERSAVHVPTPNSPNSPALITAKMLDDIAVSSPIESIMLQNYKDNQNLFFQYYTSSSDGIMRFFPAMRWPLGEVCPHGRSAMCLPDAYDGRKQRWYHKVTASGGRNLVLMLDTSGSVFGGPLTVNRLFIRLILEAMSPDDFVQVMSFCEQPYYASCLTGMWRAKPLIKRILYSSILKAKDSKPANYTRAVSFAVDLLRNGSLFEPEGSAHSCHQVAIILSDGVTEFDVNFLKEMGVTITNNDNASDPVRVYAVMAGLNPNPVSGLTRLVCNANGQLIMGLREYYVRHNYLAWTNRISRSLRHAPDFDKNRAGLWTSRHRHPFVRRDVVTVSYPVVRFEDPPTPVQEENEEEEDESEQIQNNTKSSASRRSEHGELGVAAIDTDVDQLERLLLPKEWPGLVALIMDLHGSIIVSKGGGVDFDTLAALQRNDADLDDENYVEIDWLDSLVYPTADNEDIRFRLLNDGALGHGSFTSPTQLLMVSENSSYVAHEEYTFLYAPLQAGMVVAPPYIYVWYYPSEAGWYMQAQRQNRKAGFFSAQKRHVTIRTTAWSECNDTVLFSATADKLCTKNIADVELAEALLDAWSSYIPEAESLLNPGADYFVLNETVLGWFFIGASGIIGAHPFALQQCFLSHATTIRALFEASRISAADDDDDSKFIVIKPFAFLLNDDFKKHSSQISCNAPDNDKITFAWQQQEQQAVVEFSPSQALLMLKPVILASPDGTKKNNVMATVGVLLTAKSVVQRLQASDEAKSLGCDSFSLHQFASDNSNDDMVRRCFWLDDGGFIIAAVTSSSSLNESDAMIGKFYGLYDYALWHTISKDYAAEAEEDDDDQHFYWRHEQLRYDKNCPIKSVAFKQSADAAAARFVNSSLVRAIVVIVFNSAQHLWHICLITLCMIFKHISSATLSAVGSPANSFYYPFISGTGGDAKIFITSDNLLHNQSDFVRDPTELPFVQLCATRQAQYRLIMRRRTNRDNRPFESAVQCHACERQFRIMRIAHTNTVALSVTSPTHCTASSSSLCGYYGTAPPLYPWPQFLLDDQPVCDRIARTDWPGKRRSSPHTYKNTGACYRTYSGETTSADDVCRHYLPVKPNTQTTSSTEPTFLASSARTLGDGYRIISFIQLLFLIFSPLKHVVIQSL